MKHKTHRTYVERAGALPHEWMPPTANDYANALLHVARLSISQKFQNI